MGKVEASPITRAHQRIYQAMEAVDNPGTVAWYVSRQAMYWFQMLPEFAVRDRFGEWLHYEIFGVLSGLTPEFQGMVISNVGIIHVFVDQELPSNVAELRDVQPLVIIDLPERE